MADIAPRECGSAGRRRGTVLVMVVAMLSMLFVIGVTFLNTVTFESSAIESAQRVRTQSTVVDKLLGETRAALRQGFLGNDGKPFNSEFVVDTDADMVPDAVSLIGNDIYGEVPGVHPLIASIEPYRPVLPPSGIANPATWYFYTATDLELVLATPLGGTAPGIPMTNAINDGTNTGSGLHLVHIDIPLGDGDDSIDNHGNPFFEPVFNFDSPDWREYDDGATFFNLSVGVPPAHGLDELHRRDADGDGVWDSYEYYLPISRFPESVRGGLPEELRAEDFVPANEYEADALYYSIRVIPHGAMVNLTHAHSLLLSGTLNRELIFNEPVPSDESQYVAPPYVQEGEEPELRRRFLLPPKRLPFSNLQAHPLSNGHIPATLYRSFTGALANWGTFATMENSGIEPQWWLVDTGQNGDDISAIQFSVDPNAPGWLNWMDPFDTGGNGRYDYRHLVTTVSHDDQLMRMGRSTGATTDRIEDIVNGANAANFGIDDWPTVRANQATPSNISSLGGRLKVSLPALADQVVAATGAADLDAFLDLGFADPDYTRFVHVIQDAFTIMLLDVDVDGSGAIDAADIMPAQRTAAALTANLIDFVDSNEIPTAVPVRSSTNGGDLPFVAYGLERQPFISEVYVDDLNGDYLVELYNPYDATIDSPNWDLSLNGAWGNYAIATPGDPDGTNGSLSGTINDGEFSVFGQDVSGVAGAFPVQSVNITFAPGDTIQLLRIVDGQPIVVDDIQAPSASGLSNQRYTADGDRWFVTINQAPNEANPVSLGDHDGNGAAPAGAYPVELRFANTGDMTLAFPTTGSLLLLMSEANDDPANPLPGAGPITAKLVANVGQIDNGRMPVFDIGRAAEPQTTPLSKSVPWGQLVYDYFTALPLSHVYNRAATAPEDHMPTVDQNGLRVHGRVDINSAPWSVLVGVPIAPMITIPAPFRAKIQTAVYGGAPPGQNVAGSIGVSLAQSIVAYREARQIVDAASNTTENFAANRLRTGTGFLTVGELANVRHDPAAGVPTSNMPSLFNIDAGVIGSGGANEDYVNAVALLVALGDWVTTRSHVFTIYGTIRGAGEKSAVDEKAIRFQETVDRLPSFYDNRLPRRIGPRTVGPYAQPDLN